MLIHEHQLLDLLGGLASASSASSPCSAGCPTSGTSTSLRIEALCLRELWHFVRRRARYLGAFCAVTRASLPRWRQTRPLRVAYCLAQHVEDVLDGHRQVPGEPEAYVQVVLRVLAAERRPSGVGRASSSRPFSPSSWTRRPGTG